MQNLATCLWFNRQAEEAVAFYTSVFPRSSVGRVLHWGDTGPGPKGSVLTIEFQVENQPLIALNGGPDFKFSPAISLFVACDTQNEVDNLWMRLCEGGQPNQCGWLTDRYGVSWQIVPRPLGDMLASSDATAAARAMRELMTMSKLDLAALERAFKGQ
jgi:predicted 3-demethylubiquinone-9 3-methyltransferase (glyoxalase superfamily)